MGTKILKAVLWYQEEGYSVIPVRQDKRPFVKWEKYQSEKAGKDQILEWWKKWPSANIGLITGSVSGIDVVDVDSEKGRGALNEFLPDNLITPISQTPKGFHYFFINPSQVLNQLFVIKHIETNDFFKGVWC